jgi:hypothetical protein
VAPASHSEALTADSATTAPPGHVDPSPKQLTIGHPVLPSVPLRRALQNNRPAVRADQQQIGSDEVLGVDGGHEIDEDFALRFAQGWRRLKPGRRGSMLAKLLSKAGAGVYLSEHLAGDGAIIFEHACRMGLEGIVSKRRDFPYRSGRSKCWIKVKNPASPAALRKRDGTF